MSGDVLRSSWGNSKVKTTRICSNRGEKPKPGANITGEKVGIGNQPSTLSVKRKPEEHLESQREKKSKLDSTLKIHCGNLLIELMRAKHSQPFCMPVDPVKWNIPDYFSVISRPMDLGTVKRKLEGNMYFSAEDFAADVKLTFSNAMTYNPEGNPYHTLAKRMNADFCRRWRLLEAKLKENDDKPGFVQRAESNAPVAKKGMQGTKPVDSFHDDKSLLKSRVEVNIMDSTHGKDCEVKHSLTFHRSNISQRKKKARLDRILKTQCGNILKELMCAQHSHNFCKPVDPVKLNIPDYFSVISRPMDLGTVKRKLEGNMYFSSEDFVADVKLTFSNAMTYNPEGNPYHTLAKKMNADFCRRWRLLEAKLKENDDKPSFVHAPVTKKGVGSNMQGTRQTVLKKKAEVSMDATHGKLNPPARTGPNAMRRTLQKEPCGQRVSLSGKHSQSVDSANTKCFSCARFPCHCCLGNGPTQPSMSDSSSENNRSIDSLISHGSSFHQEIDGLSSVDIQMSPKTLRYEMLKIRFAGIISKAKQQVEKFDTLKTLPERERLEREKLIEKNDVLIKRLREKKAAEIQAAGALAFQNLGQIDFKVKWERERAAARKALHEMEKTVDMYEGMSIMKDVKMPCFGSRFLERFGLFLKQDYMDEYDL